jgi:pimeloyl-ACP methyl ester carboxylesterase
VLVGHSNGTPTVRQFYRRYPERTLALAAVDGPLRRMFEREAVQPFLTSYREEGWRETVASLIESMPHRISPPPGAPSCERWRRANRTAPSWEAWRPPSRIRCGSQTRSRCRLLVLLAEQPSWTPEYEAFVRELASQVDYGVWGKAPATS